jgi:hypothetical protein
MLNKLFGGKKSKDGYYMQLDEASNAQSTNNGNGKKASAVVEKPKTEAVVVDNKKSEPAPVKAVVEEKTTSKKKTSGKSKSQAETAPVAPAPKKAAEYEPPFWVKAMNANTSNSNSNGKAASSVESFAESNLMPLPNRSRRRPGPSLNPFMDMARQVKNSNSRI